MGNSPPKSEAGEFRLDPNLPVCRLDIPGASKCIGTASCMALFVTSHLEPSVLEQAVHHKGDANAILSAVHFCSGSDGRVATLRSRGDRPGQISLTGSFGPPA